MPSANVTGAYTTSDRFAQVHAEVEEQTSPMQCYISTEQDMLNAHQTWNYSLYTYDVIHLFIKHNKTS